MLLTDWMLWISRFISDSQGVLMLGMLSCWSCASVTDLTYTCHINNPTKKGYSQINGFLKKEFTFTISADIHCPKPRNVPIRTKDHYANPEGMSDHRRSRLSLLKQKTHKSMVIFLDNGLDCSNDAKKQSLLFFHRTRSRERHQHNTRNPDGS